MMFGLPYVDSRVDHLQSFNPERYTRFARFGVVRITFQSQMNRNHRLQTLSSRPAKLGSHAPQAELRPNLGSIGTFVKPQCCLRYFMICMIPTVSGKRKSD